MTADEDMPFLLRAEEDFPDADQEWRDPYGPLSISALAREPELYIMEAEYLSVQEMKQDPKKGEYSPHPVDTTLLPDALMLYCLTSKGIPPSLQLQTLSLTGASHCRFLPKHNLGLAVGAASDRRDLSSMEF